MYYVDDILVIGGNPNMVQYILNSLTEKFSIKEATYLHYVLGTEATRTISGLHLMLKEYIVDLIAKHEWC